MTNNNPDTITQADFDDIVGAHFDGGCDECVSSKDAYWHETDLRGKSYVSLLEQEVKDYEAAVETHRSALARLTNPVAIANCAQALSDTRTRLAEARARLARLR